MTSWVYFDADGEPLPTSDNAVFKGKEVREDTTGSASSVFGPPGTCEYQEVHAIAAPSLRKAFKSSLLLKEWCRKQAEGKAR